MVTRLTVRLSTLGLSLALAAAGCVEGGEDAAEGGMRVERQAVWGPRIVFNPLEVPVPDIPFPNDLSLRNADDTDTGRAWNVSPEQPSAHRSRIRRKLNTLDGFGPYAPIFVSFDGPLDLATVTERSVVLVNIEPGHPRYGERAPLDLGKGYFPLVARPGGFFGQDPNEDLSQLMLPRDNLLAMPGGKDAFPEWYEVETHTLIVRPIVPLASGARHAVLITKDVMGLRREQGEAVVAPVRSPFEYKAHAAQSRFVREGLKAAGLDAHELAFGWTYTTADVAAPMLAIRDGIYGQGTLARIDDQAKDTLLEVRDTGILHDADGDEFPADARDHRFILQGEFLGNLLKLIAQVQSDSNYALEFPHVDYFVFGSVETPDLRMGDRRDFDLNHHTGEGPVGSQVVPFVVSVPKATAKHQPPFPVMFYFHGTGTSRMESVAIADAMARQGIAVMAFDEVGHGPLIPDLPTLLEQNPEFKPLIPVIKSFLGRLLLPDRAAEILAMEWEDALEVFYSVGLFAELAVYGRNTDEDGDGFEDVAEGFFFADPFRQCSSLWQDTVDLMQLVRVMRGLRQADVPPAIEDPSTADEARLMQNLLAGDFNADGVLDIGGPDVQFSAAGTSLGGFHSVLAAALEPEITVVTPIVAGGGFVDIMLRSSLRTITERLFLDVFGTVVVGCPTEDGKLHLSQGNDADRCRKLSEEDANHFAFGQLGAAGGTVTLSNLDNGEETTTTINATGGFSVAVETDKGDRIQLTYTAADGETETHEIVSRFDGAGYQRNTSDFRRTLAVQQHVFDRCDPVNFARNLFIEPLPGHPPTNVMLLQAIGDDTVPVSTGVNLAIAAGALGLDRADWQPRAQALIEAGVLLNQHVDVDDVLGDDADPIGPFPTVKTPNGVAAVRFADVNGKHEYIAGYDRDGFQYGALHQHMLAIYHRCGGRVVHDADPVCLQSTECAILDDVESLPGCAP